MFLKLAFQLLTKKALKFLQLTRKAMSTATCKNKKDNKAAKAVLCSETAFNENDRQNLKKSSVTLT